MNYRRSALSAAAAVFLTASAIFLGGCGQKEETPAQAEEQYGIVDMETLIKAHPRYSEYYKLETEYDSMRSEYKNEQNRLIQVSSQQEQAVRRAASDPAIDEALNTEYQSRMQQKEDELNAGLKAHYDEVMKKYSHTSSVPETAAISQDEGTRIANLQMKILILDASGEEKEKAQKELAELLNQKTPAVSMASSSENSLSEPVFPYKPAWPGQKTGSPAGTQQLCPEPFRRTFGQEDGAAAGGSPGSTGFCTASVSGNME